MAFGSQLWWGNSCLVFKLLLKKICEGLRLSGFMHVSVHMGSIFMYMHKHSCGSLYCTVGRKGQHPDLRKISHLSSQYSERFCHLSLILIPLSLAWPCKEYRRTPVSFSYAAAERKKVTWRMVSFSLCCIFRPPYGSAYKCIERATISATVLTWNIGFGAYNPLLHDKHSINTWWKKRQMVTKKILQSLQFVHLLAKVAQKEDATNTEASIFWICLDIALPYSACSFMHKADVPPLTITHLCQHSSSYIYVIRQGNLRKSRKMSSRVVSCNELWVLLECLGDDVILSTSTTSSKHPLINWKPRNLYRILNETYIIAQHKKDNNYL